MLETSVAFAAFLVMWLIGLSLLSVLNLNSRDSNYDLKFCLAPAAGLSLITLAAFPLYRYIGPVSTWGWPALLCFIIGESILI